MTNTPGSYEELKRLFCEARELPGSERRAFLDAACAGDAETREAVERLLEADAAEDGAFDVVEGGEPAPIARGFTPPEEIGGYRVTGVLGEGGMGIVLRAEQERPRREVAVKVLRSGLVSAETLRRFEHEAEVLGRLQHPGIAQVYEAGTAEIGGVAQPFFVLELVEGLPLIEHADRAGLSIEERLGLLVRVCEAVEHAHQKAVVHRDLKPGNILVDRAGRVKVLDFGIARVTDAGARATSIRTLSGMVMGTLAYMSPEQAVGGQDDVDTRSDVYALGVLAYELIAGRLPHDFDSGSFHRAVRMVVEDAPVRLGVVEPRARGDLETIVSKALEKDRARRFPSAAALAEDLRRFLAHEPIRARRPGRLYLLRKFTQRNKALVGGLAAAFVALTVGLVVSLVQYGRADDARRLAEEEGLAAKRQADKANAINDFILQDMLAAPDPFEEAGDIRVSEVLDRAAGRIEERFAGEPALEADVRATIGNSYVLRGLFGPAEAQLAEALRLRRELHAGDHEDLARSLLDHAILLLHRFEPERSEEACREALAMARRLRDEDDADVGAILLALGRSLVAQGDYEGGRVVLTECLGLLERLHGNEHGEVLAVVRDLGGLEYYAQNLEEAMRHQERALALARSLRGDSSPHVAVAMNDLGQTQFHVFPPERQGEAVDEIRGAVERLQAALGDLHPTTLRTRRNLGIALNRIGETGPAETILREVAALSEDVLGPEHADAIASVNALADFLMSHGSLAEVLEIYEELVPRAEDSLGLDHPDTMVLLFNQAWALRKSGDLDGSLATFRDSVAGFERAYGPASKRAVAARKDVTMLLLDMGDHEAAGGELRAILEHSEELGTPAFEDVRIDVAHAANRLGAAALEDGDAELAAEYLQISYDLCRTLWDADNWRVLDTRSKLGAGLAGTGRDAEAEGHLLAAFETLRDARSGGSAEPAALGVLQGARSRLVEFYAQRGDVERAERYRR